MPYIGNTIRAADDYRLIDDISSSFNGSTTSFALQVAGSSPVPFPKSPQQVLISVNGVIQEPDPTGSSGFNLVGTNIVFSSAPTNGHAFFGIIYATADYLNAGGNFPSGSLGAPSFTFIGDENTGLYRKSGGSVGFVSDATEIANFDSNGITISSGNLIIPDKIIHNGDTNTAVRFPAADTVTIETAGSERLRVDSSGRVMVGTTSPEAVLTLDNTGLTTTTLLHLEDTGGSGAHSHIALKNTTGDVASILTNSDNLEFRVDDATVFLDISANEHMRIDASGRLLIGTTSRGADNADNLTIAGSSHTGLTIRAGTTSQSAIYMSDATTGSGEYAGYVLYDHNVDALRFGVNTADRLKIDSSGHVLPAADSTYNIGSNSVRFANGYFDTLYGDGSNLTGVTSTTINNNANNRVITGSGSANTLEGESSFTYDGNGIVDIEGTGAAGIQIKSPNTTDVGVYFRTGSTNAGALTYLHTNNSMNFRVNSTNKLTINSDGDFLPGSDDSQDLGSSSKRWQNIFTTDLQLSNEGSQNDVDSTWGNYTIQEGHEDLFLINNRTGKKFKFNLTEVA